jgi:prepilin signal peptidase PulO-like enzyme (type II secretory pathway)
MIDIFAWIVLIVVICLVVGVFLMLGALPGHVAHKRGHPWAEAVAVGGWVTLLFGFVLWPLALVWAYVDFPSKGKAAAP